LACGFVNLPVVHLTVSATVRCILTATTRHVILRANDILETVLTGCKALKLLLKLFRGNALWFMRFPVIALTRDRAIGNRLTFRASLELSLECNVLLLLVAIGTSTHSFAVDTTGSTTRHAAGSIASSSLLPTLSLLYSDVPM
jgi:hypothetical protein